MHPAPRPPQPPPLKSTHGSESRVADQGTVTPTCPRTATFGTEVHIAADRQEAPQSSGAAMGLSPCVQDIGVALNLGCAHAELPTNRCRTLNRSSEAMESPRDANSYRHGNGDEQKQSTMADALHCKIPQTTRGDKPASPSARRWRHGVRHATQRS